MNPYDTTRLFEYLRSIYGRQFTQKDSDMRTWQKHLDRYPVELVIDAVDKYALGSSDDFPPNLAQLAKLCKTMKSNVTMLKPAEGTPRLEQRTSWQQWSVYMAHKLLFLYEWEPRPTCAGNTVSKTTEMTESTPEFKSIVEKILDRVPEYFADYALASDCDFEIRDRGSLKIFHDIGAKNSRKIELFQKMP